MKKIKPKKSLGQNWLKDVKVLEKIIQASQLNKNDNILEIGPGKGVLTERLRACAGRIIMVEKDRYLAESNARNFQLPLLNFQSISDNLSYKFKNKSGVISGDVLKINLPELIKGNNFENYKVVANIPYYITGKLIKLLLETEYSPEVMILLVQKEVAERICAQKGKMNILAVAVQYFGKAEIIDYVSRKSFEPVPRVDSAIIRIKLFHKTKRKNLLKGRKEFFSLVKIGFASKRKTLVNNLVNGLGISKEEAKDLIGKINKNKNIRAEALTINDWQKMVRLREVK